MQNERIGVEEKKCRQALTKTVHKVSCNKMSGNLGLLEEALIGTGKEQEQKGGETPLSEVPTCCPTLEALVLCNNNNHDTQLKTQDRGTSQNPSQNLDPKPSAAIQLLKLSEIHFIAWVVSQGAPPTQRGPCTNLGVSNHAIHRHRHH